MRFYVVLWQKIIMGLPISVCKISSSKQHFQTLFHQFPIHIQSDFNGALQKPWCGLFEDFNDELILFEKQTPVETVEKKKKLQ